MHNWVLSTGTRDNLLLEEGSQFIEAMAEYRGCDRSRGRGCGVRRWTELSANKDEDGYREREIVGASERRGCAKAGNVRGAGCGVDSSGARTGGGKEREKEASDLRPARP